MRSAETLMERIKPVVTEKNGFEISKSVFFERMVCQTLTAFDWDFDGATKKVEEKCFKIETCQNDCCLFRIACQSGF